MMKKKSRKKGTIQQFVGSFIFGLLLQCGKNYSGVISKVTSQWHPLLLSVKRCALFISKPTAAAALCVVPSYF
jgi:hypothetical protein